MRGEKVQELGTAQIPLTYQSLEEDEERRRLLARLRSEEK